jgi:tetratricopeptide (TPR) repeat protein
MWQELVTKALPMEERQPVERLGYRAAYLRLAGKKKEFDEAVAALRKHAEDQPADSPDRWSAAKSLFLVGRPDDALALLDGKDYARQKADILAARMKFTEALETAGNKFGDAEIDGHLDVVRARTLHYLGKKDEAGKIFAELGKKIGVRERHNWYDDLVEAEYRAGLKEQAYEHCAHTLQGLNTAGLAQMRLLRKVVPGNEEAAQAWWWVLRDKQASEQPTVTMKSLRKVLAGEIKGKELMSLAAELENVAKGRPPDEQRRFLQAVGEVALKAGDLDLAQIYFEEKASTNSPLPLIKWGDYIAGKKKWDAAAEVYGKAWEKDRRQPLALYLRGHALVQAGKQTEGEALMEQSHWLPLGDDQLRLDFVRELSTRNQSEAAKKERDLLLRTCPPGSFQAGEAQRLNGIDALHDKEYLKAARWHELAMLRCHRTFISFIETQANVGVPHFISRLRARGLVMAGKFDEAKEYIDFCEKSMPGNPDLAIQLVPALEKQGKAKEADDLYRRMRDTKRKLCKEYPDSVALLNSFAWMAACCRRDLDEAQERAEKAVSLEPSVPGYRDTLAEVLFQRGKKDQAITNMKRCLELDPKREYYRKQLKRFEAGDPKVEVPPEID